MASSVCAADFVLESDTSRPDLEPNRAAEPARLSRSAGHCSWPSELSNAITFVADNELSEKFPALVLEADGEGLNINRKALRIDEPVPLPTPALGAEVEASEG